MKTAVIDFSACRTVRELHEELARALDLPGHYGANLDALWDCLSGGAELPARVRVKGPAEASLREEAGRIYAVFDEARRLGFDWTLEGEVTSMKDLQQNVVPALNQNRKTVYPHPDSGLRILFAGNSITKHAPKPEIGWERDCGMAASCLENDYVHRFMRRVREQYDPHAGFCIAQVAQYEREFFTMNLAEVYQEAADFDADLILLFFGANVDRSYDGMENPPVRFGDACERIRDFLNPSGRARVFYSQGFYIRPVLDEEKRRAALRRGDEFICIEDIRSREDTHGEFNHPSDLGMRLLADRFFERMEPEIRRLTARAHR